MSSCLPPSRITREPEVKLRTDPGAAERAALFRIDVCRTCCSWPPPMLPESCQATSQHSFMSISRQPPYRLHITTWGRSGHGAGAWLARQPTRWFIVSALRRCTARLHHQTLCFFVPSHPFPCISLTGQPNGMERERERAMCWHMARKGWVGSCSLSSIKPSFLGIQSPFISPLTFSQCPVERK